MRKVLNYAYIMVLLILCAACVTSYGQNRFIFAHTIVPFVQSSDTDMAAYCTGKEHAN